MDRSRALHWLYKFESAVATILNGDLEATQSLIHFIAEDPGDLCARFESHRADIVVKFSVHSALVDVIFVADGIITRFSDQRKLWIVPPCRRLHLLLIVRRLVCALLSAEDFGTLVVNHFDSVGFRLVGQVGEEFHVAGPGLVPWCLILIWLRRRSSW